MKHIQSTDILGILCIIMLIACCNKAHAQVWMQGGAGVTNKYFSADLQVGYRTQNVTASVGYIALPKNDQPALFNARAGYVFAERVHAYGGYVRSMRSSDNKELNKNTWQVGVQYLFSHYNKGTFYIGSTYTGTNMISVHVGMTWNLSQGLNW